MSPDDDMNAPATRRDVQALRSEVHGIRDELRIEMHGIRDELRTEMRGIRDELLHELKSHANALHEMQLAHMSAIMDPHRDLPARVKAVEATCEDLQPRVLVLERKTFAPRSAPKRPRRR